MTYGLTIKEHMTNEGRKLYGRSVEYQGVYYILGEITDGKASLYKTIQSDQPDFIVDLDLVTFI